MKKIILKKPDDANLKGRIGYKIRYDTELNQAQYEAVMHNDGAALVIAGAGTGKTRTLIYRVSRLVEDRVPPESILLLTFTRKSSAQMLRRASLMLDGRCDRVSGGTYHSFALNILRRHAELLGFSQNFNVLDQGDSYDTINLLRTQAKFDKSKKRFPQKDTLGKIFNLTINKCLSIEDIVMKEYPHYAQEIENIQKLNDDYINYKKKSNLMDYDDLLIYLLALCQKFPEVKAELNQKYKYVMVDEYQDTNRLQHEIVLQLAGKHENVMAVGDDAQSIYSFRGAEFQNIMNFPQSFSSCKIYKIEENYRSTQNILNLTNKIIADAAFKYEKELYSRRTSDELPKIISAENEQQQSLFIVQEILELREQGIELEDIAVLFRSSFLSTDLELELNKANLHFLKFGGMKFIETSHIKDLISYFKILFNPKDAISWNRVLLFHEGVGPKMASRIIEKIATSHEPFQEGLNLPFLPKNNESLISLFKLLNELKDVKMTIGEKAARLADFYIPIFKNKYDDYAKRQKDLDTFLEIASRYNNITNLLNDMAVEPPIESLADLENESKEEEFLTLSTIHSAKGLEWRVVFLIFALEGRFPAAKSIDSLESLEEERRLFYVATTRAKDKLYITYPTNIFDRTEGIILSRPSRFLNNVDEDIAEHFVLQQWDIDEN